MPSEPQPGILLLRPLHITGISLTRLQSDGRAKAAGNNKIMLGGSGGSPMVIAPIGDLCGLGIAEGIEDALTLHIATGLGVWAAGSASRLPALAGAVPSYVDVVSIVVDDDNAGRHHSSCLAAALVARGFEVRLVTPLCEVGRDAA